MLQNKFYELENKKYDRITAILSVVNSGLQNIPKVTLQNAADRGIYFHKLCQNFNIAVKNKMLKKLKWKRYCKELNASYSDFDADLKYDYNAYCNFILNENIEILEIEKIYYDDKLKIAGQIDLLAKWQNKLYLMDIKYVTEVSHLADLQTAGYQYLLRQNKIKADRIILPCRNLKKKLYPIILKKENDDDDYSCFLAALKLYRRIGGATC